MRVLGKKKVEIESVEQWHGCFRNADGVVDQ